MFSINYQSSLIDWCESNYGILSYFINSITSLSFTIHAYYHYSSYIPLLIYKKELWRYLIITKMCIGVSHLFFHLTMSELGQLLDELFIAVYICMFAYIVNVIDGYVILPFIVSIIKPDVTRFCLLFSGLYYIAKIYNEIIITGESIKIFNMVSVQFIVSLVFWTSDMLLCPILPISLHWLWHIYASLAQHNFITLTIGILHKDTLQFNLEKLFYITLQTKKNDSKLSEIKTLICENESDSDDDDFVQC